MNEDYIVEFFFSSGEIMLVAYSEEKFIAMYTSLQKCWNNCCIASEDFGINFSQVTHYKVKINK